MSVQETNSAKGEKLDNPGTVVEEDGLIKINGGGPGGGSGGGGGSPFLCTNPLICGIIAIPLRFTLINGGNTDQPLDLQTHRSSGNNITQKMLSVSTMHLYQYIHRNDFR